MVFATMRGEGGKERFSWSRKVHVRAGAVDGRVGGGKGHEVPTVLTVGSLRRPFIMEVAERTEADKKGGHLAVRKSDGQLLLRESAQVRSLPSADSLKVLLVAC